MNEMPESNEFHYSFWLFSSETIPFSCFRQKRETKNAHEGMSCYLNDSHVEPSFGSKCLPYMSRRFRSIGKGCLEYLELFGFDSCSRSSSLGSSSWSFIIDSWSSSVSRGSRWGWSSWIPLSIITDVPDSRATEKSTRSPSSIRRVSGRRRRWRWS